MRSRLLVLAPAALALACFDFDATTRGGPLLPDGGGSDASAIEAGPGAPDGGGSFCAAQDAASPSFFCDDFDERAPPGLWNSFGETAGKLAQTDASFVSSPFSLEENTNPITALPIDVSLRKHVTLPSPPARLALAFDVEPVTTDTSPGAAIVLAAIDFLDQPGDRYSVQLSIAMDGSTATLALGEQSGLVEGGAPFQNHPLPNVTLPSNQWTHVVVELDWTSATSLQGIVTVGATKALDLPLTMTVTPSGLQVGIGTSYVSTPSTGWTLRYDDVFFTTL